MILCERVYVYTYLCFIFNNIIVIKKKYMNTKYVQTFFVARLINSPRSVETNRVVEYAVNYLFYDYY